MRAETPAAEGQREVEGGAPYDAAAVLQLFLKKYAFVGVVWSKFLRKILLCYIVNFNFKR